MNSRVWLLLLVPTTVLVGPASGQSGRTQSPAADQKRNQATATASPQQLYKRLSPSVFVVEALNESGSVVAFGSGVVVARGQVVTNEHVIKEGVAWRIRHGTKSWPATVTQLDSDHDLCHLKAAGLRASAVPVRFSSTLVVGEHVYAIGAPAGLELTLSEGLISGLREFEQARLIQTSAPISPGSSGGGLFDAQGRLVGVTTFVLMDGQNLNFALPGEWVQGLAKHPLSTNQKAETNTSAIAWFQLGFQAGEAGEHEKAVRAYQEAIRLKPDIYLAWYNLGNHYIYLGQYDQAVRALQEAIRLKPDIYLAWYNLGNHYIYLGQYDQAVRALQEAIRLKPDYPEAWNRLGAAYNYWGRYDQATMAAQEAIRLKPEFADAWVNLGAAYTALGQYDQAIKVCQEAIRLKPDYPEAWYNLGIAYGKLGQYDQAIEAYQEAIRLKPDKVEAWNNLGAAYNDLGQHDQAARALQEVIRLKPYSYLAWYNLGHAYTALGQYDQAIKVCQEAIRLKPDYAEAWYILGLAYARQGNRSKVMQVYEKLKTLDPNMADEFFQNFVLP